MMYDMPHFATSWAGGQNIIVAAPHAFLQAALPPALAFAASRLTLAFSLRECHRTESR